MIKLLDINRQDKKIRKLILKDFNNIINKGSYILGKEVSLFESRSRSPNPPGMQRVFIWIKNI